MITEWRTHARGLATTWRSAWLEAWANRRSFWLQIVAMIVNDVVWIVFWWLFFRRVGELRGWDIDDVIVLFAILTTSAGFVLGLTNNVRRIGDLASSGGLDAVLALPTPPLLHLLARRIETVNVGDLFFGLGLFVVLGDPSPARFGLYVFGVVCSVLVLGGFLVLAGSASFFTSRNEAGDLGFHAILLFANYPVDIFSGVARFLLYGVVPAAFVSTVPAKLIDSFEPWWALGLTAVALGTATLAWAVFTLGLRRYTSGAVWTAA